MSTATLDIAEAPSTQRKQKGKARGNGEGSIFHVASSDRWRAQITWTDASGKVRRKSKDRPTQREAQEALRALVAERERMTPGARMTVADWFTLWLADERGHVRASTHERYTHIAEDVLTPRIGHLALGDLTPRVVEQMCDQMASKYASTTIQLAKSVLGISLKRARRDGHITGDPVGLSRSIKAVARPVEVLTPEQTKRLLAVAAEDHVIGPIVTTLVGTGMRIGECIGLQVGDLDIERSRLHIRRAIAGGVVGKPKSARGIRTLTLPGWCVDALRDHLDRQRAAGVALEPSSWLFLDDYGRVWTQTFALDRFHALLKANRLPKVRLHSLRHGHATSLLDAGADLLSVSRRLGHSSTEITSSVYVGTLERRDEDLASRLGDMLG